MNDDAVLYVYRCANCSHEGKIYLQDDDHQDEASTCEICGGAVTLEWDGGVTLLTTREQALDAIEGVKDNLTAGRNWVIQRFIRLGLAGEPDAYLTLPEYRPMTRDQMLDALKEAQDKYPNFEFRGHRLMPSRTDNSK